MPAANAPQESVEPNVPVPGPRLHLTGERTLPGIEAETYWFRRHLAGYRWAAAAVAAAAGSRILDSGCGEGYGTALLGTAPNLAVGVDVFDDAVAHAALTYGTRGSGAGRSGASRSSTSFVRADASQLPFPDAAFDAVVSLQVIEHLPDPDAYAAECARVVRRGGLLLVGTPNRVTFTPEGRPKNPFHVVEFDAADLVAVLAPHVSTVRVVGLSDRHPGLADALIDAAFAGEDAPPWAQEIVPTVTEDDFGVGADPETCLDLFARCSR